MTNLTRANGTLKIVNRKIGSIGNQFELAGVVELTQSQASDQFETQTVNGTNQTELARSNGGQLPVIVDELELELEELKENQRVNLDQDDNNHDDCSDIKLIKRNLANGTKTRLSGADETQVDTKLTEQANVSLEQGAEQKSEEFKAELVWRNIILFIILHSSIPMAIYQFYWQRPWLTVAWSVVGMYISGLGVTGGAHRLWSHRSYKASLPVEILLMLLQTMAGQNSIYTWCRDHRVHHKFSETNADPHNIKRGFFFAHMGWLCCKKHPDVKAKGKLIDMSDLEANPVVMFQHRHFWWLAVLCTVVGPTYVPVLLWNERFWTSFVYSFMLRYLITLHGTWLVNSAAHYFGSRPYDERIEARESPFVIATGLGEGFHNYHHTFPYDYSTSEFGKYFNITTAFIDACAALRLVHDRRKMDRAMIDSRMARTGRLASVKLAQAAP